MGYKHLGGKHEPVLPPPPGFHHANRHHELTLGVSHALHNGGRLPGNPWWHYVQYRHDLAAYEGHHARFAHYHPRLIALLDRDAALRAQDEAACPTATLLPKSPDWLYLEYRYSLNPARFSHFHPSLAGILASDAAFKEANPCVMAEMLIPPPPSPGGVGGIQVPGPSPQPPSGQAVPEPSSAILLASGLVLFLLVGRRFKGGGALVLRKLPVPT